ncbi:hypothetical protein KLER11_gp57 [Pararheinheimera phage vB_PsoM_KLER1-1]|nr:hypothetical protein KLER11_gp57 [Pararheinheimera phage vB_PsoM_KLER1-1]
MHLTKTQLQLMVNILHSKPKTLSGLLRETVSQLHDDKLIAFTNGRYVVTGRGQCAMTVSGYKGPFEGVEIQPRIRTTINLRGNKRTDYISNTEK